MKTALTFSLFLFSFFAIAQDDPEKILLNDYSPVSIYNVAETIIDKAAFPVIDMHSHPYAESIEDLDRWVEIMKAAGFDEKSMVTWHQKFEEMEPEEHQKFLESLGIKAAEIKNIRNL